MKFYSLADEAIFFNNKFRLVYNVNLVDWVKLDPAKQQKEVTMKKDLVSLELFEQYRWQ